ncbi:hypothetical protein BpHYR1_011472 [Brachionus plicatilis]|uniref:Uncharacterized protein n=1 Tax=Brachionus plicatilis TaxID=10195 RepID=A0A3M7QFQ7_BRAPC|nr:hypothetical protein BpHYR1_011472 [Brachionus plicatilis]
MKLYSSFGGSTILAIKVIIEQKLQICRYVTNAIKMIINYLNLSFFLLPFKIFNLLDIEIMFRFQNFFLNHFGINCYLKKFHNKVFSPLYDLAICSIILLLFLNI